MFNGNYTQQQLPSELFNANGDVNYNGVMYHVSNHGNGTRDISPFSSAENAQRSQQQSLQQAQAANQAQIQANQPAIATLQGQGSSLADQYKSLLESVTNQGKAAFDTATSGENAYLGQRGLLSQSGLGNNQLSQTQNTVNTTNAANQAQVQAAATNAQVPISQAVASLQAGNLPQAENFTQNLYNTQAGITNTNTQYQEALQQAQLEAGKPFGVGNLVFNPSSNNFSIPKGYGGGYGGGGNDPVAMAHAIISSREKAPTRQPMAAIGQFVKRS